MATGDFGKVEFGFASAEKEKALRPQLLVNGYVDIDNAAASAKAGHQFLFLGYKGSGKSGIGQRLLINAENDPLTFVKNVLIGDFPFTPFSKIIRGNAEPESKYPVAWSWLMLVYIIESFSKDSGLVHQSPALFEEAMGAFKQLGLAPNQDIASIVRKTTKSGFKLQIPKVLEYMRESGPAIEGADVALYVEGLKGIVFATRSESTHYIVIDGLDDIITKRGTQNSALGSLFFEVGRLNEEFMAQGVPAKIIVLCRTDLFERVSNANKNKARQDSAIVLDWYHDPQSPQDSRLIEAANARATLALKRQTDVFADFFPQKIDGIYTERWLLDLTRHTPRDFLQLLKNVQSSSKGERATEAEIKAGARTYSINYFLPEIKDELDGYCSVEEVEAVFSTLSSLREREFSYASFKGEFIESGGNEDRVDDVLRTLFDCSAIGNVQHRSGGNTHYTFSYRNRQSKFTKAERILLHKGLWKSLNLR
ncbi:hypothetical protein [Sphingomonas sp. 1185]|uniref:P-loop ATPase, Sll1717 family n=1 Tax=Sphingomonas sp. 1185 TaxID=3156411 RepID=UPI003395FFDB